MTKEELRSKLIGMNIHFMEQDSIEDLLAKYEKATQNQMVVRQKDESVPFLLMDLEDENQIIQEANGSILKDYIYSFEDSSGKKVVGLSKAGVDQVCRESANHGEVYRVIKTDVQEDPECYKCIVTAGRFSLTFDKEGKPTGEVLLDTAIGSKRQLKVKAKRGGGSYTDPFAFEVCISKAQRNAKKSLLPYKLVEELIKKYLDLGHVKVIRADAKISDAQLKLIHAIAGKNGMNHEQLKALVKKEFGYESVLELEVSQCDRVITLLNDQKAIKTPETTQTTENPKESQEWASAPKRTVSISQVPQAVVKAGRQCEFTDAKIIAYWDSAIEKFKLPGHAIDKCLTRFMSERMSKNDPKT